jgi:hypothetical protein
MNLSIQVSRKPGPLLVLLLAVVFLIMVSGCGSGNNTAPYGSVLSIGSFGPLIITGGTTTTNTQQYRVTVIDTLGNPMNGISVDITGTFTAGDNVTILESGQTIAAPATFLPFSVETDKYGYVTINVSAPQLTGGNLGEPSGLSAVASSIGGNLDTGTYSYCVTAVDSDTNQTAGSSIVTAATTTNGSSIGISWTAVSGASGYYVYGRTAGGPCSAEGLISGLLTTASFIDTGSVSPGVNPPGTNNTKASNSVKGSLTATSGAASASTSVSF